MTPAPPLSAERFAAVERHVRAEVGAGRLPHAQVLATRKGETLCEFAVGAARADGRPLGADAVYRIASMTKPVTAALFLMLVEEGRVALDDPVASVLPELSDLRVHVGGTQPPFATRPATRQPVMRDLLTHTAGFTYGFQTHSPVDQAYWRAGLHNFKASLNADRMLADLARIPLVADPGERFTYSVGIDLIGIVAERLTGEGLGALLHRYILDPLGMADTGFWHGGDRLTDAWAEHEGRGRYLYDPGQGGRWSRPPSFESGGAGLVSTAADYHRFAAMLLAGGAGLLSRESVVLMTRNQLAGGESIGKSSRSLFAGPGHAHVGQGLGLAVTLPGGDGAPPAGEVHWSGMFGCWFSVVPAEDLVLVFMTQRIASGEALIAPSIQQLLFA